MKNSLFLKAAACQSVSRPPVWFMRQAGRYMPEYRTMRQKYSFLDLCYTPEAAAEVTLQPIKAFDMDTAILFSDILLVAQAMGGKLRFSENNGPVFDNPVRSLKDVENLTTIAVSKKLSPVYEAIKLTQKQLVSLQKPLIGFAGAPFTVSSYLIEGASSRDQKITKQFFYREPKAASLLLDKLVDSTAEHLNAQIQAGVDAIQIFDSWANALSWDDFKKYSLKPVQKLIAKLEKPADFPVIVFCRGSSVFAPLLQDSGATVIGLDWQCDLKTMRQTIRKDIALQGNLDPHLLHAPHSVLQERVVQILKDMSQYKGYIFNLGHGIEPDVKPDTIKFVVDLIKGSTK